MNRDRIAVRVLWVAVAALLTGGAAGAVVVRDDASTTSAAATPTTVRPVALPNTPAGTQLRWVLDGLVITPSEGDIRQHFNGRFLAAVPPAQGIGVFRSLGSYGPFQLISVQAANDHQLEAVIKGKTLSLRASIVVEPTPPHLISGLLFKPESASTGATTWPEVDQRLRDAAPEVGFLAAEVVDGECRAIHAIDSDVPLSIGSAFKLYVLGAVIDAVKAGRMHWDGDVAIRDDLRVHSSAILKDVAAGQTRTVREMAEAMISVSDNTATDHLMARVSRLTVEKQQAVMGMADPSRNVPMLSTRELSLIKWAQRPVVDEYRGLADATARRRFLDDRLAGRRAIEQDMGAVAGPVAVDSVEWFASANDLCRAHVALQSKASGAAGEPVRRILSVNPGVPFDDAFTHIAFKGGSEPGVLAGAWYLEHRDGRRFFIGVLLRDTIAAVDSEVLAVAADAALVAANG